ncbi:MAG TPA: thiol peroxidase [Planctomycetaceae bacterium]|nr:thiol peroxidase [Planctomycetaceae bacterium]
MAQVTLKGNPIETVGNLPAVGSAAPEFTLVKQDLSDLTLSSLRGKRVVLNIFPSVDTGTCAKSVRTFNQRAASLKNTQVVCVSADLPFALGRFCGAEGIDQVITASTFRCSEFGTQYGVRFTSGPLKGLLSRSVVVIDENGKVLHAEQVSETVNEPNYDAALAVL